MADCVLGVSWVLGGAFWFVRIEHRSWCYLPSLLTVVGVPLSLSSSTLPRLVLSPILYLQIVQCVTVVLTVTYAVVAYRVLKRQELSDMLVSPSTSYTYTSLHLLLLLFHHQLYMYNSSLLTIIILQTGGSEAVWAWAPWKMILLYMMAW